MCWCCYKDNDTTANYIARVERWASRGLIFDNIKVLARPSAQSDPNTYVFVLENAIWVEGRKKDVYVDIHYMGQCISPGAPRKAIGGLWIRGVDGSMKPSQHGGELLRLLKLELPARAPRIVDGIWGDERGTARLPRGLSYG